VRRRVSIALLLIFACSASIAEGVEAELQVTWLEALRCRYGQGNFLSPPMDAVALEAWAAARVDPAPAAG
jgi:EAL domain-containing protein (putative c-di-GMP-specific phosphodiesterase class I)